jgi:hypothetical protein
MLSSYSSLVLHVGVMCLQEAVYPVNSCPGRRHHQHSPLQGNRTHRFRLDPGRTAALTGGSALGVRVQLRVLFVSGGVLVLIVSC